MTRSAWPFCHVDRSATILDPYYPDKYFRETDLTAFLYQRMRDYCIGMISSRWAANGANVCGAGGL
jgi:hypothetical protein